MAGPTSGHLLAGGGVASVWSFSPQACRSPGVYGMEPACEEKGGWPLAMVQLPLSHHILV